MDADDSFACDSALAQRARGRWRYLALFGTRTVAAVVLYWTGLLLYRQVLADPRSYPVQPWTPVWSLSSIVVMQIGYWISYHLSLPLPRFRNVLLGHAVLFLGRMAFVLPTSAYSFVLSCGGLNSRSPSSIASSFCWVCSRCIATCGSWSAWVGLSSPEKRASTLKRDDCSARRPSLHALPRPGDAMQPLTEGLARCSRSLVADVRGCAGRRRVRDAGPIGDLAAPRRDGRRSGGSIG